ncbi:MAG: glutamate-5-semialdehyde dehydrogenase [Pirellulales bacterium]|nr:glutamate-5-semialdehyde dehydrogenase [Pirellulales bacterium]
MTTATTEKQLDLPAYAREVASAARAASVELAQVSSAVKNAWLQSAATELRAQTEAILAANQRDLAAAPDYGLTPAAVDRLKLTPARIAAISQALVEIASLPDPVGELIEGHIRPNGLEIQKVRVPLGVVFFIYESRPNVTADAAAICLKSGNAVILRGGKEAAHSSQAIVKILRECLIRHGLPAAAVQIVETTDRAVVGHFLELAQYIDVAIPRGGEALIRRVTAEAKMPVIKHFDGNCHVYVDEHADLDLAEKIIINSKCQRMGVCNTAESLVIHAAVAKDFLPRIAAALAARGVELRGDERTRRMVPAATPATEEDYGKEYLGPILSCVVVDTLPAAIEHIGRYGSKHTDAIITRDLAAARAFAARVDSSAVMINASTRFNDGGEFGLGAEIGISTDKFHARGPCGLKELTTYKYIVYGTGQIRE